MIIKLYKDRRSMKIVVRCALQHHFKDILFCYTPLSCTLQCNCVLRAHVALIVSLELSFPCHTAYGAQRQGVTGESECDIPLSFRRCWGTRLTACPIPNSFNLSIRERLTQPEAASIATGKGMGEVLRITKIPPYHCGNSSKQQQQAVKPEAHEHAHTHT